MEGCGLEAVPLELWSTPVNEGLATDDGLAICGARLASDLAEALEAARVRHAAARLLLIGIAHSFGGPILRGALAVLDASGALTEVTLASFVTLASPHVGTRQLNPLLRLGARFLGKVFSTAYQDLLLDSEALDELCTPAALAPLARFRHRSLYACAWGDHLVAFSTGALMVPLGNIPPPVDAPASTSVLHTVVLDPIEGAQEQPADGSRTLLQRDAAGSLCPSPINEVVSFDGLVKNFAGFDDKLGRAERAARMLLALRGIGSWTLNVVAFQQRLVLHHAAILHHPARAKNPGGHGADVAEHVSATVCEHVHGVLRSGAAAEGLLVERPVCGDVCETPEADETEWTLVDAPATSLVQSPSVTLPLPPVSATPARCG